jgi:hypothetical protein
MGGFFFLLGFRGVGNSAVLLAEKPAGKQDQQEQVYLLHTKFPKS